MPINRKLRTEFEQAVWDEVKRGRPHSITGIYNDSIPMFDPCPVSTALFDEKLRELNTLISESAKEYWRRVGTEERSMLLARQGLP